MYKSIIEKHCEEFENRLFSYLNSKAEKEKAIFPFASFMDEEFYKQNKLSKFIERSFWKYLANGIISDLFKLYDINCEGWPSDEDYENAQSIKEYEKKKDQFIVIINNIATKYRYTEYDEIINSNAIVIDFRDLSNRCNDKKENSISIKEFFVNYFSEEVYFEYLMSVSKSMSKIDEWYGIKTIPLLNKKKYNILRIELESIFDDSIRRSKAYLTYKIDMDEFTEMSSKILEKYNCISRFIENNHKQYFLCENEITKCFITSEYLFSIYSNEIDICMDYSSVVCGYFKSIEILLCNVLKSALNNSKVNEKLTEEKINKMTLEPLINELISKKNHILQVTNRDRVKIQLILKRYKDECRNNNFHKDLIDDITFVNMVRHDTFYIYCLVLTLCEFYKDNLLGKSYFDNL